MKDRTPDEAVQGPCGLWTIWDNERDQPAVWAGRLLIGLSEDEARAARDALAQARRAGRGRNDGQTAA